VSCVKLLKKFLKLLVDRERADYFHSTVYGALGVVLVGLRVRAAKMRALAARERALGVGRDGERSASVT
jgi:hypothetical protein